MNLTGPEARLQASLAAGRTGMWCRNSRLQRATGPSAARRLFIPQRFGVSLAFCGGAVSGARKRWGAGATQVLARASSTACEANGACGSTDGVDDRQYDVADREDDVDDAPRADITVVVAPDDQQREAQGHPT